MKRAMAGLSPNKLLLRRVALTLVVIGAVASITFMLRAGRHQQSRILLLLFAIWVLSPFVGAVLPHVLSKRRTALDRPALYLATLAFSVGSLTMYGTVAFGRSTMKVGFIFLIVPLASWLLLAAAIALAVYSRGPSRPDEAR